MIISFVDPSTPPFDVVFNRVAAAVTGGKFCHCEIAFENVSLSGVRRLLSCYSTLHSQADLRAKGALETVSQLFPPSYDANITVAFYALQSTPLGVRVLSNLADDPFYQTYRNDWTQYRIAGAPDNVVCSQFVWCLEQVGKPYDIMGALTSPWKSHTSSDGMEADRQSWFCSNHALRFCQHMALLGSMGLSSTTPNELARGLAQTYKDTCSTSGEETDETAAAVTAEGVQEQVIFDLALNQSHWGVIGDLLPYVIRTGHFKWDRSTLA